jgi:Uma2 family endonuclease
MVLGHTSARKLNYRDYLRFPDDGLRHEILNGEHYVTPAPSFRHQRAVLNLAYHLEDFLRRNPLGCLLPAPFEVVFSEHDLVQPDLLFVSNARAGFLKEKNVQGAPDLVIEVLSSSTRRVDEGVKRGRYERFGVQEYWLVDPQSRTVRVLRRAGSAFGPPIELAAEAGDVLTTPLLAGLQIQVAEIFE